LTIKNYSSQILENPEVYFENGISPFGLPLIPVPNGKGLVWGACKTAYSIRGTSGVFLYHIKDSDLSLAVYWSLPYIYWGGRYSNWWNVKVYQGPITVDQDLFQNMKYGRHLGDSNLCKGKLFGGLSYGGSMGGAGECTLDISLRDSKA